MNISGHWTVGTRQLCLQFYPVFVASHKSSVLELSDIPPDCWLILSKPHSYIRHKIGRTIGINDQPPRPLVNSMVHTSLWQPQFITPMFSSANEKLLSQRRGARFRVQDVCAMWTFQKLFGLMQACFPLQSRTMGRDRVH